jgi:uncharacterized protein (DUF433 family)
MVEEIYPTPPKAEKANDGLKNNKPGCIVVAKEMKTYANEQTKPIELRDYIVTDPDILGGEPVFRGTRVPVVSLFEHLESDCPLDEFLDNFPSVSRAAAVAVITGAQALLLRHLLSNPKGIESSSPALPRLRSGYAGYDIRKFVQL